MPLPNWFRLQFSLRALFVTTASVAAACWMFKSGNPELAFFTAIPLAEGFVVGEGVQKHAKYDGRALAKAIVLFPAMVWVVLWILATISTLVAPVPGGGAPPVIQAIAIATLYLPGMVIWGAPAGIAGVMIGHALRKVDVPTADPPS